MALLDTGLDLQHPDFIFDVGRQRRVRGHKNFIRTATGSENRDVSDQNGHGTHTAGLLLDFSPEADVYIAKIAEHDPHDCQVVAEVNHRSLCLNHGCTNHRNDRQSDTLLTSGESTSSQCLLAIQPATMATS